VSRHSPRPLAIAIDGLTSSLEPATTLARAQRGWERAVGERIALAGRPTGEREGVLTVTCADSVWSAELEMMGPELVERLNAEIGERLIDKLRCRTG
jgi:predicted nucleic acid-binding Zn ribbon protein